MSVESTDRPTQGGPLNGLRVIELAGIGPAPHACMLLADLGADVIRVERVGPSGFPLSDGDRIDAITRSRRIISVDLKDPAGIDRVLRLVTSADVMVEGFRPGVTERLGVGPEACQAINPRLIYARMTGWGQSGPLSHAAGHDLNYISLTGILENIGRPQERPIPPLNLVGDFGGGSMFLVMGVLAALYERERSGQGQVIDAAMCDGASVLAQMQWAMRGNGHWNDERGTNMFDGSRPYYDTYMCGDGRSVAVACIEPQFFARMLALLDLDPTSLPNQFDDKRAGELRSVLATRFASAPRDHWAALFEGSDACVTPVLTMSESLAHSHMVARRVFTRVDGVDQPRPAPRFSRTNPPEPVTPKRVDHVDWHEPVRPPEGGEQIVR
ncbi:MAG TPA: CaiB/BaiF CoA-transferase family protein [Ilumatobacter sp.]|nr:CaiB/BaiF CoA-transferase family protein [Ilumatobacter sp.]